MADKVLMLDGKGNLDVRSNTQDVANNNFLIEELRKTKAIVTHDDSQQEGLVPSEDVTPQVTPKATTKLSDAKNIKRQRGDLGLYRFYFFSSGIWTYLAWMLMAAINMLWGQMPCITHPHPALLILVLTRYLCSDFPSHLARQSSR